MAFDTGTANDYVSLLNKLIDFATSQGVTVATVSAGGTGYTVGDILTASGGTFFTAATFRVKTVSSGAVTAVIIVKSGAYTSNPSNPVSTTGGTGTGCTLTLTFASNGWTLKRQSQEAVSATIQAGGTGYAVNDIVSVVGGTEVAATAQFKVTTVSSGAITAVVLWSRGNYGIIPTNPVSLTGGSGSGGTLNVTWQRVTVDNDSQLTAAVVSAGGTGYTVGDILTLSGGTFTTAAQVRVTTVSSGAVTGLALHTRGEYTVVPTNPVSTTGGTGTGATVTATWGAQQPNPDKQVILEGNGSGSDQLFVGIRTFNDSGGTGARNWELAGMSGYNAASTFATQPNISPGRFDETGAAQQGAYVPMSNSTTTYWFVVNGRRIIVVARMSSTYTNAYLGWVNPFATALQYTYPMAVIGCSSLWNRLFSDAVVEMSGMVDPVAHLSTSLGPGFIRDPAGSWKSVRNSGGAGSNRVPLQDLVVLPCGQPSLVGIDPRDQPVPSASIGYSYYGVVPGTGSPGTVLIRIAQVLDSPSNRSVLYPTFIMERNPAQEALGELADVVWVSALGDPTNLAAEDSLTIGDDTWRVFQNCNRTDLHAHFAILEK